MQLNWGIPGLLGASNRSGTWLPECLQPDHSFWQLLKDKYKLLDEFFWSFNLVLPAHKGRGTQVNVWANIIGLFINVPCGQSQIQRWLTCRDTRELKRSIYWAALIGMGFA